LLANHSLLIALKETNMKTNMLYLGGSIAAAFALVATAPAMAMTGQELVKDAKVSLAQARQIALKAHAGKITDEELETEKGGTGLRYSFDIKGATGVHEVGVDARTGKVLENKKEGPNPD
jgi:uncharacterized membrane protein YkoI